MQVCVTEREGPTRIPAGILLELRGACESRRGVRIRIGELAMGPGSSFREALRELGLGEWRVLVVEGDAVVERQQNISAPPNE